MVSWSTPRNTDTRTDREEEKEDKRAKKGDMKIEEKCGNIDRK